MSEIRLILVVLLLDDLIGPPKGSVKCGFVGRNNGRLNTSIQAAIDSLQMGTVNGHKRKIKVNPYLFY